MYNTIVFSLVATYSSHVLVTLNYSLVHDFLDIIPPPFHPTIKGGGALGWSNTLFMYANHGICINPLLLLPPPSLPREGYIQGRLKGDRVLVYLGIIDILQSYRLKKKVEHTFKSMITDGVSLSL